MMWIKPGEADVDAELDEWPVWISMGTCAGSLRKGISGVDVHVGAGFIGRPASPVVGGTSSMRVSMCAVGGRIGGAASELDAELRAAREIEGYVGGCVHEEDAAGSVGVVVEALAEVDGVPRGSSGIGAESGSSNGACRNPPSTMCMSWQRSGGGPFVLWKAGNADVGAELDSGASWITMGMCASSPVLRITVDEVDAAPVLEEWPSWSSTRMVSVRVTIDGVPPWACSWAGARGVVEPDVAAVLDVEVAAGAVGGVMDAIAVPAARLSWSSTRIVSNRATRMSTPPARDEDAVPDVVV
jgi:hypothetical protein